jgi:hypothetical protein
MFITVITPDQRASILILVSRVLPKAALASSAAVTEAAVPLADWAGQADGYGDAALRMRAMHRAADNLVDAARAARDTEEPPVELSPALLLSETRTYYAFITETPVPAVP